MRLGKIPSLILIVLCIIPILIAIYIPRDRELIKNLSIGIAATLLGVVVPSIVCYILDELGKNRFREIVEGENIQTQKFPNKGFLSFDYMKAGARLLYAMIEKSKFHPDVIIGVNRGGLVVATAIHTLYQKPMGVIHTADTGTNRYVEYINLPNNNTNLPQLLFSVGLEYQTDLDKDNIFDNLKQKFKENKILLSQNVTVSIEEKYSKWLITDKDNKKTYPVKKEKDKLNIYLPQKIKVLVVDVKFKSGYSAKVIVETIKRMYSERGQEVDIKYAVTLMYTGGSPSREFIKTYHKWPASLDVGESKLSLYSAFYTNANIEDTDKIGEELRNVESLMKFTFLRRVC